MTASETIRVERCGGTAWVTLDRPPLNVLDTAMMRELGAKLKAVVRECGVAVFRGAGTRGFSAGAEVRDHTPERVGEMLEAFHGIFRVLAKADCVTIAAVHGHCLGGGCELATFCDFVVAAHSAKFGQPEIKLGCFPPVALVTLPRLAGLRAALDLILSGRTITAAEAERMGLVSRLVAEDQLAAAAEQLAAELAALSPAVLGLTRRAIWQRGGFDFDAELAEVEQLYLGTLVKTADAGEGIRAFLERRAPAWQGR